MLHFLNPGGLRRGRTKGVGGWEQNIDSHFTMVYCHCKPHSSPLPLSRGRRRRGGGWGGKGKKKKKKKGGEEARIDTIF